MSHISSTFSHLRAGKLLITFRGTFDFSTSRDAGFPSHSTDGEGVPNISLRAFVGPTAGGVRKYTEPIDRFAPVAYLVMDYPGGNASWPVGTEEVAHVSPSSGLWSYSLGKLIIEIKLVKK